MNQGTVEPPGAQQGAVRGGLRGSRRGGWRGNRGRGGPPKTQREPKDRPTHFISVPLDQIRPFTSQVGSMTGALLAASPPISGLDRSIVISPARLHLTLGVMSLKESPSVSTDQPPGASGETTRDESSTRNKTLPDAAEFLQQLKPLVRQMMNEQPIQLTLDELAVMRRSPEGDADVMYLGPSSITPKSEEHNRSVSLLQTIHERFRQAGFVTETRPLKLHCTVLNTSQRRSGNRSGPRGVPFSIFQIEQTIDRNPSITGDLLPSPSPLLIRELHICRMGSYDESGRYVRVASMVW